MTINASGLLYSIDSFTLSSQGSDFLGNSTQGQFLETAFQAGHNDATGQTICSNIGFMPEMVINACNKIIPMILGSGIGIDEAIIPIIIVGMILFFLILYRIRRRKANKPSSPTQEAGGYKTREAQERKGF